MSAPKNPFDAMLESFRGVVREEIAAALERQADKPPKLLLTTGEAAAVLGVPETWLASQARAGNIPCVKMGHYTRFKVADLEQYLSSQPQKSEVQDSAK